MASGLELGDERVRELAAEILAREEYAAHRLDVDAWRALLRWIADGFAWLEGLRFAEPGLFWTVLIGLVLLSLLLLGHVVWTVSLALRMPDPDPAAAAGPEGPSLLVQAERLAGEGRFLEASRRVELATLALLLERRWIELARSDPNRVLRRRLRAAALPEPERGELLALLDRLESGLFRDGVEDPELYAGWRALHARLAVLPEPGRPALPAPAPGAA